MARAGAARAASHRIGAGARRRRLAAAARRSVARAPRRALPRRAARVPAGRARGLARAARDRPHRRLARCPPGRVPGLVPARRGDEPVPVRPARQRRQGLSMHARCRAALPGAHQRPAARPHRPAHRGAGGAAVAAGFDRRRRIERGRRDARRRRTPLGARSPGDGQLPARRRGARSPLPSRRRGRALPADGDDAARLVGARLSPRPARRAHDRRSRGEQPSSRSRISPRRSSTGARSPRAESAPRRGRRVSRPSGSRGRAGSSSGSGTPCRDSRR